MMMVASAVVVRPNAIATHPRRRIWLSSSQNAIRDHPIPEAVDDLKRLSAFERAEVRDALETHLRHEPTNVSRSRIKRLRESTHPQYRLRVDDLRILHDIEGDEVQVLAIVEKSGADEWLREVGGSDEDGPAVGSEG
jgi:mRNA-degrading endonuclease RelE of RelBE toxin-antitoxin system